MPFDVPAVIGQIAVPVAIIIVWEAILKPDREKRSLARVLSQEMSLVMQNAAVAHLRSMDNPKGISPNFSLPTIAFDAVCTQIGYLPSGLVFRIIQFYFLAKSVNTLPGRFESTYREFQAARITGGGQEHKDELDDILALYKQGLEHLVKMANDILPDLHRASVPLWHPEHYFRKPEPTLTLAELKEMRRKSDDDFNLKRGLSS